MGGVFGVFGHSEAASLTYRGLYGIQHRGEKTAGIVGFNLRTFLDEESGQGKVAEVFSEEKIKRFLGKAVIGQIGKSGEIQPIKIERMNGSIALGYDGKIVNSSVLRKNLEKAVFYNYNIESEVETVAHLILSSSGNSFRKKLFNSFRSLKGAFSLLALSESEFIAVRDPYGFRPLCLGELDGAYVFGSESCAFDVIGAKYLREVKPGEVIVLNKEEKKSYFPFESEPLFSKKLPHKFCVYEWVYFSRPDSRVFQNKVAAKIKTKLGKELAKEEKIQADVVIPLPDSSNNAALGFAWELGMRCHFDIVRSHYVEHSPEEPEEKIKDFGTKIKFNLVPGLLEGKRVILVVHSIIRGKQIPEIIQMIKTQAKEVHVRVSYPPIIAPCEYGIDFPTREDFIAKRLKSEKAIASAIGADSVRYLTMEGLYLALGYPFCQEHCYACLTGEYPL